MRGHVINEVRTLIHKENGLNGKEWDNTFFAPTDCKGIHVSKIDYKNLSDEDLLRFLVYLVMEWDGAIQRRLKRLVDAVWNHVTESEEVPSTKTADDLIKKSKKNE